MGCVYVARNRVNNKRYVGKTLALLAVRISRHVATAKQGRSRMAFAKALAKYGEGAFEWTVLFESDDNAELCNVERRMIAILRTKGPLGYNLTAGGDGSSGFPMSEEARRKLRKAATGRVRSAKSRKKQSDTSRANKWRHSDETRAKISATKTGVKMTDPKLRERLSEIAKARTYSEETRRKMANSRRGRKHSEESKKKIAESKAGKKRLPFSEEWRNNLSIAHRSLTSEQELEIRSTYRPWDRLCSMRALAKKYGVSSSTIRRIVNMDLGEEKREVSDV